MNYDELYIQQLVRHYCTARELQYSVVYGHYLNLEQINEYYQHVDNLEDGYLDSLIRLNLKTFNSKGIFFSRCNELSQSLINFLDLLRDDLKENNPPLAIKNMSEINRSRIYSEVEGSLNIEQVPTTRRRFDELVVKDAKPQNKNDRIIKNMANAIEFVLKKPDFNKENLYKLYNILSEQSLDYDHKLKDGDYYRYDDVYVDDYKGCPVNQLEECMNSLFAFVNSNLKVEGFLKFYLPHIVHYYILYIHPYFDFNGRTARMVSLWVYLLTNNYPYPPFISDAINQTKDQYYASLIESRDSHNDLTYFFLYILDTSITYYLVYKNVDYIASSLKNKGIILTNTEKDYIKRILVCEKGPFSYTDFTNWNHIQITKQGAFKILNRFVTYGILKEVESPNNKKLFILNKASLLYSKKSS